MNLLTDGSWKMNYKQYEYNNVPFNEIFKNLAYKGKNILTFSTFDIETYTDRDKERAYTYSLQFFLFEKYYIFCRTWNKFMSMMDRLLKYLKQHDLNTIVYVHNLAYEWVFLYPYIKDKITDYFAKDHHTPLYVEYDKHITFKCSYQLTNMSLAKFLENENVPEQFRKLGDYDYFKRRFYNSKIKRYDRIYMRNDVIGLALGLRHKMEKEKKQLSDLPLTSTGYVRKAIRNECPPIYREIYKHNFNTYNNYLKIKKTVRGGDTHGNRFKIGKILYNVICYDICSSYPYQLLAHKYPIKKFKRGKIEDMKQHKHAFCCKLKIKNGYTLSLNPYISVSKCEKCKGVKKDNGRVVSFEYIETYVNDIDYYIILNEYKFENIEVVDLIYSEYEWLPNYIVNIIKRLFNEKEELKRKDPYFYTKAKNLLNSIFGCMCTSIVFDDLKLKDGNFEPLYDKKREKYNSEKNKQTQPYIGSWVTAYARKQLRQIINLCGDNYVYCDTDSVFFEYDVKIIAEIEKLNKLIAYKSPIRGTKIGRFEPDKTCKEFKFLGAKKYAYKDQNDTIHITVAGVPKNKSSCLKSLEEFKDDFVFENSNTKAVYSFEKSKDEFYNGHVIIECLSSLALIPVDYTLNMSNIDMEVIAKKWLKEKNKNIIH